MGLTLTDNVPALWYENKLKRKVLFEGEEEGLEFLEEYRNLQQQALESFEDRITAELYLRKGLSDLLYKRYDYKVDFEDDAFEEFDEHVMGTLLKIFHEENQSIAA